MKDSKKLFEEGILEFAKKPKNNPVDLNFPYYTIALVADDYPAKTPVMWNAVYSSFGIDAGSIMAVGNQDDISKIFDVFRQDLKYLGGGLGVGFKDKALQHLDDIDKVAKAIGSVNVVKKDKEGKLIGYNTDGMGYTASLEELLDKKGKSLSGLRIVMLGAGGTGNSIAFALAEKGSRLTILNRSVQKAEKLAERINDYIGDKVAHFGGEDMIANTVNDVDVVINVSVKGTSGALENYSPLTSVKLPATEENINENIAKSDVIFKTISEGTIISDIVLRDEPTPFLRRAKELGFETLDGIPMVINQGVQAMFLVHGDELSEKAKRKEVFSVMKEASSM